MGVEKWEQMFGSNNNIVAIIMEKAWEKKTNKSLFKGAEGTHLNTLVGQSVFHYIVGKTFSLICCWLVGE